MITRTFVMVHATRSMTPSVDVAPSRKVALLPGFVLSHHFQPANGAGRQALPGSAARASEKFAGDALQIKPGQSVPRRLGAPEAAG